jgi:predicted N-acetyltransferase YhbS
MLYINNPVQEDVPKLKNLWLQAFGDTKRSIDLFFEKRFDTKLCFAAKVGEEVIAAAYVLPVNYGSEKAGYLYALATKTEFRRQGIMGDLLKYVEYRSKMAGCSHLFLYPAEEALYSYYEKQGYTSTGAEMVITESRSQEQNEIATDFKKFDVNNLPAQADIAQMLQIRQNNTGSNALAWDAAALEFAVEYDAQNGGFAVLTPEGYAICKKQSSSGKIVTSELVCKPQFYKSVVNAIFAAADDKNANTAEVHSPYIAGTNGGNNANQKAPAKCGLAKGLFADAPKDFYIGLKLD